MAARSLIASLVLAALVAQDFVGVVEARSSPAEKATQAAGDVKKPDCVPGLDPRTFPGIGGHGGGITPVPSHGGITPVPSHGGGSSGLDPSHGGSPSHGGGGYGGSPSHGGSGGDLPSPSPSHGGFGTSPSTGGGYGGSPSTPSHGGGAYGGSPSTPSHGGAYGGSPTPGYGGSTTPMPFVPVDPHGPSALPGSCDYWRSHPMEIWSAIGSRFPTSSSMGHFFSTAGSGAFAGVSPNMSIQDALGNTRTDGAGSLLREGAAALLNSMTRTGFPYTTDQVRDAFTAAAAGGSDGAAAAQAAAFKKANEARA